MYGDWCHRCVAKASKKRRLETKSPDEGLALKAKRIVDGARKRRADASVSVDKVLSALRFGFCERTGIRFVHEPRHPHAPSIDRIDSSRGYSDDNVQIVCLQYNMAKNHWTDEQLLDLARRLVDYDQKH